MYRDAIFNRDRTHRYALIIQWDRKLPRLNFIMLNPSTADEVKNDPTVERQYRRARKRGYGTLLVTNIFALRSTDPKVLYDAVDPIGSRNDHYIRAWAELATDVFVGWGTHGALLNRGEEVLQLLKAAGISPRHLGLTKDGHPRHPLYMGYDVEPQEYIYAS